jgi:hypothetical protein
MEVTDFRDLRRLFQEKVRSRKSKAVMNCQPVNIPTYQLLHPVPNSRFHFATCQPANVSTAPEILPDVLISGAAL